MPIRIIYHNTEGRVTVMPFGYEGSSCHDAARVYEDTRTGKRILTEGEAIGAAQEVVHETMEITQKAHA